MKNLHFENSTRRAGSKAGRGVVLFMLTVGSVLLVRAIPALSGDASRESTGRDGSRQAKRIGDAHAADQVYPATANELVNAVIANELTDREQLLKWVCVIEKRAGKETLTEEQVETREGPLYRLLAIDGTALSAEQRQQDNARIDRLMKDPSPLLKLKQAENDDELKLQKLLSLMPHAFVYEYDGAEENLLRVKFKPNPDYSASSYEERVIHNLAGTMLIDPQRKRMTKVAGHLVSRVEFGYGLLGRIDSGTVELERVEVGPLLWKTAFINIHFSGRVAIFKTVSKDQYERRSDFRAVASDLSLAGGKDLLVSRSLPVHAAALR
ncbi:MAG TPA: hypothetical protein VNU20_02420 [Candidatus Sulfotelmatobacter sp.]|jgi:hypothetical protein|nr:hypothetical protein [Candidatus Sulfotelmatobacter sp.]